MKIFRKADIIVALVVLAVAATALLFYQRAASGAKVTAEIWLEQQLMLTLPLESGKARDFSLPERPEVILRLEEDGSLRFLSSDCPDQICVKAGKLHLPGQTAACLPNGVIIRLVAAGEQHSDSPDLIAG